MMTKRKTTKTAERTTTQTRALSPLEDAVVRMRHGLRAPPSLALANKGGSNEQLAAELEVIEQRVMAAVGARNSSEKGKIVDALRSKNRP